MSRKDILYVDPSSNLIVSTKFSSSEEGQGTFAFLEEYSEEAYSEPANSYTVWFMADAVPALDEYLEARLGWSPAGDPAERLVHCLEELISRGELNRTGGRSALREQVFAWCEEAGLAPKRGGVNRREVVLARGMLTIEVTVDSTSRQVIFQEGHGPVDQRAGLYQIHLAHTTVDALIALLERQSGKQSDGDWQDRLFSAFKAVSSQLAPGDQPMAVRDRVAGWLAEAGIPFQSYGSEWQTTLLRVHRQRNDCVFSLRVTLDPERGAEGIRFTEFYDYLPLADDPGREYGYTVHAPYESLPALVAFLDDYLGQSGETDAASLQTRLIDSLSTLIARGELGDSLPLRENHLRVARWFEAAGVPADTETWSWINSD